MYPSSVKAFTTEQLVSAFVSLSSSKEILETKLPPRGVLQLEYREILDLELENTKLQKLGDIRQILVKIILFSFTQKKIETEFTHIQIRAIANRICKIFFTKNGPKLFDDIKFKVDPQIDHIKNMHGGDYKLQNTDRDISYSTNTHYQPATQYIPQTNNKPTTKYVPPIEVNSRPDNKQYNKPSTKYVPPTEVNSRPDNKPTTKYIPPIEKYPKKNVYVRDEPRNKDFTSLSDIKQIIIAEDEFPDLIKPKKTIIKEITDEWGSTKQTLADIVRNKAIEDEKHKKEQAIEEKKVVNTTPQKVITKKLRIKKPVIVVAEEKTDSDSYTTSPSYNTLEEDDEDEYDEDDQIVYDANDEEWYNGYY
jgi:hypothetical protein